MLNKQHVCVQLSTSAANVALPAIAARLMLAAVNRYLLAAGPTAANPQQQHAAAGWDRRTDRRTDGRTPDRCTDPAPHAGIVDNCISE